MARTRPLVGIVMGSTSDWGMMEPAARQLKEFGIPYDAKALSAHRTPDALAEWIESSEKHGVPMPSKHLQGLDSLLSMVQMPKGIPVATFAIGEAGAANAALFAVSMLALSDANIARKLEEFRERQTKAVLASKLPE